VQAGTELGVFGVVFRKHEIALGEEAGGEGVARGLRFASFGAGAGRGVKPAQTGADPDG
jgi:hypothetical protein